MTMLGITDLATYIVGTAIIVLLPGPNSLYVLAVATRRGVRSGYEAAMGVVLGDAILMVLTAIGAGSLLKAYPFLFVALKYAGGAYLAWIGVQLIVGGVQRWRSQGCRETPVINLENPFKKALAISLTNPKAILFFISFFVQFVDPAYQYPGVTFAALGFIGQVLSILYLSALIFAGSYVAEAFQRRVHVAAGLTGAVGALFIGFGAKLATATV